MSRYFLLASVMLLSGCFAGAQNFNDPERPEFWHSDQTRNISVVDVPSLKGWWQNFNDPALNQLIGLTLRESPDRLIAEARVLEARGLKRSARAALFPEISASAETGREKNATDDIDNFYDAGFDASYEIDLFGKNRKNNDAAAARIESLEAEYHDITLTLIAEVARSYISYRAFQKQYAIAEKNLEIQEQTLELIRQQHMFGEAPKLDVERAENLVNTTKASIPEFRRLSENTRLQLSVLTGKLPQDISSMLKETADIPGGSLQPVFMAPADVLAMRPDIRAASANLKENTALAESVTAELFPTFSISGFFGVTESILTSSSSIWNVALGTAVSLIDFGRIEGRIDAARARETQAYQLYRKTILEAVTEVETALNDVAYINEKRLSLQKAYDNADQALQLSQLLYREGEISFLDILDVQRTVNEADADLVSAEAEQAESYVRLYKSLGVY